MRERVSDLSKDVSAKEEVVFGGKLKSWFLFIMTVLTAGEEVVSGVEVGTPSGVDDGTAESIEDTGGDAAVPAKETSSRAPAVIRYVFEALSDAAK